MKSVGIVGLGIMGGSFGKNLLIENFEVIGFDILPKQIESLCELGAKAGKSPKNVAEQVDVVITSLPSLSSFHEALTGQDGIASANNQNLIVLECSTMPIEDKIAASKKLAEVGTVLLDCPISGTGAQAVNKDLSVYGSGNEAAFQSCESIFSGFAKHSFYVGEFGNGSKMKFVANHLVHIHNVASAEAMVLGMKAGLDPNTIYEVISKGAGNSRIFELRGPMMVESNYSEATMKMEVWLKDMTTIGDFATNMDCPTPLFTAGRDVYLSALAQGMQKLDTAAVCRVLENYAGIERERKDS